MSDTGRTCGSCTACCFVPEIDALAKPPYRNCQHVAPRKGCRIYAERPGACRDYACLWLSLDMGELRDRPDRLGLVFDVPADDHPDYAGIHTICAREVWPGARHEKRARALLAKLASGMVVRLSGADLTRQLMGPASLVAELTRRAEARRAASGDDPPTAPAA